MKPIHRSAGFTLIEMVVSIVILGIIGTTVAMLMRAPIDSYFQSKERAQLSDAADNALRRMARDIRLAVPNSVRVTTAADGRSFLEFLQTTGGGRYRALLTGAGGGNALVFGTAVTQFDVLGPLPLATGASAVVVGNVSATATDQPNAYLPVANAYSSRATCSNCAATPITIVSKSFPLAAEFDSRRFFLVRGPVSYECDPSGQVLRRHDGYSISQAQPTPAAGTGIAILSGLTSCSLTYSAVNQDVGVVSLSVGFVTADDAGNTSSNGGLTLVHHVHVSNTP